MADLIDISSDASAEMNLNLSNKIKRIAAGVLASTFMNKTDSAVNNTKLEMCLSMKKKLFLKYIMTDYELILNSIYRNDKLSPPEDKY